MTKKILERIVVGANFTIEPIHAPLVRVLEKVSRPSEVVFAPYNQILQQLLDPASLFHKNRKGVNVVFLRLEDLIDSRGADIEFIRKHVDKIKSNTTDFAKRLSVAEGFCVPLFVFLCPASAEIQSDLELAAGFHGLEQLIREAASNISNLYVFGTEQIAARYQIAATDNPKGNVLGHVPYSTDFISALALESVRKIDAYYRKPFKVLALDCDNTLWDGVVGEDGVDGIGLSDERMFLQKFAVEQSESGMVVCLISKNNEGDVWEVFEKRENMVLKKEHIVSSRINWLPKSQNLKSIADELQLGLASFIFVDDDPVVCDEVQRNCPEVLTVKLPSRSENLHRFLDHLWVFDKLKITQEDRDRTLSYKGQALRREHQAKAGDLSEFLESLQLVCEISELNSEDVARVSQLSQRTNQFNSTTIRLSEADIRNCIAEASKSVWIVKVRDRFGDYGLVGVVIFAELADSLIVESFMLSCRVLGRGVEHQVIKELGKRALETNREFVALNFSPTAKNAPILNFFTEIGELYRTADAVRTIYKLPATVAADCQPRQSEAKQPAPVVVQDQTHVTDRVIDVNHLNVYVELAHSLVNNLSLQSKRSAPALLREKLQSEFHPPRTDTQRSLTQIWESTLKSKNIGTADNFFEIGGDSLIAVALFVEIEEQLGRSLPISSLLDSPTIEKLAELIDLKADSAPLKYLVAVQPQGTKLPLFCMHAAGGNVLFYRDLADALGSDQPVYGLQAKGVADKSETAHDRVEDMAAEYLKEIFRLQPRGPYQLCGSSFGGLVAFECARQLLDAGKSVSVLAVFDTYAPQHSNSHLLRPKGSSLILRSVQRVRNTTNQIREIRTRSGQIGFVFDRINRLKERQKRKILWKKNEFAIQYNKATGRELPNDMGRNHRAIRKAEKDYHPAPYDGGLILITASEQPYSTVADPFLGWKGYVNGEIVTEVVRGTHGAIAVYPSAVELATKLDRYLNQNEILPARAPAGSSDERGRSANAPSSLHSNIA